MFRKIYTMYITVLLVSFLLIISVLGQVLENYFVNEKESKMIEHAKKICNEYMNAYVLGMYDQKTLTYEFKVLEEHLGASIWYVDAKGKVYVEYADVINEANTSDKLEYNQYDIEKKDIQRLLEGNIITIRNKYISKLGYPVITVGYPMVLNNKVLGAFLIHTSIPEIKKTSSETYKITIVLLIFMVGIISVAAYIFSNNITKPLKMMKKQALKYAQGDFTERMMRWRIWQRA